MLGMIQYEGVVRVDVVSILDTVLTGATVLALLHTPALLVAALRDSHDGYVKDMAYGALAMAGLTAALAILYGAGRVAEALLNG